MKFYVIFIFVMSFSSSPLLAGVPIKDNILFAFDKCKSLSVSIEKGQLKESPEPAFDLHCRKVGDRDFKCDYFDASSTKKLKEETFTGDSDLGVADLREGSGKKIKFLIGKNFASFEAGPELKACVGIYLFEQDALKKKSQ